LFVASLHKTNRGQHKKLNPLPTPTLNTNPYLEIDSSITYSTGSSSNSATGIRTTVRPLSDLVLTRTKPPTPQPLESTSTTTASTKNRNSMFIQDEDAYIAIHHHHFDKHAYLSSLTRKQTAAAGPVLKSASHTQIQNGGLVIPVKSLVSKSQVFPGSAVSGGGDEANFYNIRSSTLFRTKEHSARPGSSVLEKTINYDTVRPQSSESTYWACKWTQTDLRG